MENSYCFHQFRNIRKSETFSSNIFIFEMFHQQTSSTNRCMNLKHGTFHTAYRFIEDLRQNENHHQHQLRNQYQQPWNSGWKRWKRRWRRRRRRRRRTNNYNIEIIILSRIRGEEELRGMGWKKNHYLLHLHLQQHRQIEEQNY